MPDHFNILRHRGRFFVVVSDMDAVVLERVSKIQGTGPESNGPLCGNRPAYAHI